MCVLTVAQQKPSVPKKQPRLSQTISIMYLKQLYCLERVKETSTVGPL